MTRALTSRRLANRLGSSSSISLPAQSQGRRAPEFVGMGMFWAVVLIVVSSTLVLYCWPAAERIHAFQGALEEAEEDLETVRAKHAALELEVEALDDPFTVEWILRRDHNWQPTEH